MSTEAPLFNDLTTLPNLFTQYGDDQCADQLNQRYGYAHELGAGQNAVVLMVIDRKAPYKEYALRIVSLNEESINTLYVAEQLDELREETEVFGRIYGWFVCNSPLESLEWHRKFKFTIPDGLQNQPTYLYMFMEAHHNTLVSQVTLPGFQLNREVALPLIFLVIHGLMVARENLGFVHKDLHGKNIMFQPLVEPVDIFVEVPALYEGDRLVRPRREWTVPTRNVIPRIIDFDTSAIVDDDTDLEAHSERVFGEHENDVLVFGLALKRAIKDGKFDAETRRAIKRIITSGAWKAAENAGLDDVDTLIEILWLPEFDGIKNPAAPGRVQAKCSFCPHPAVQRWTDSRFKFCENACHAYNKGLKEYI